MDMYILSHACDNVKGKSHTRVIKCDKVTLCLSEPSNFLWLFEDKGMRKSVAKDDGSDFAVQNDDAVDDTGYKGLQNPGVNAHGEPLVADVRAVCEIPRNDELAGALNEVFVRDGFLPRVGGREADLLRHLIQRFGELVFPKNVFPLGHGVFGVEVQIRQPFEGAFEPLLLSPQIAQLRVGFLFLGLDFH